MVPDEPLIPFVKNKNMVVIDRGGTIKLFWGFLISLHGTGGTNYIGVIQ